MISKETILHTKNYQLRIPNLSDIDFVFSASRHKGFNDGMQWNPPTHKDEIIQPLKDSITSWEDGTGYSFTITSKDEQAKQLGRISIRQTEQTNIWNIGYWTHPEQQGKGIMTEAIEAILAFGFATLNAIKITAQYANWNKGSEKVLVNNGFKFVKYIEKGFLKNNEWISENEFALTKEQWQNPKQSIEKCGFCKRLNNNKNTIFENDDFVVLLDIDPISIGHVLICPKQHYTDFHNLPDDLLQKMMLLAKQYINTLQRLFSMKGYSMMLNAGTFNDLKHCHLHIFPRNSSEEFQWQYSEKPLSDDATKFEVLKQLINGHL